MSTPVLSARGIGLCVGGRWLLRDVDLDLFGGQVLGVVGPNGAGKSTLVSLLAGDGAPTEGSVRIAGDDVSALHPRPLARRRAVLEQSPVLSFPFRVADVVAMGRAPWTGTAAEQEDEHAIAESLAIMDVTVLADRSFTTLSGGERARVSFARVHAQRTTVVLLDEPTAALDLRHQERVMCAARACAVEGRAVLAVVHDLGLAAAYCDEIAVLDGGCLVARGEPWEVLRADLLEAVYDIPLAVFSHPVTGAPIVTPRRSRLPDGAGHV